MKLFLMGLFFPEMKKKLMERDQELALLKRQIEELYTWCAFDFPEVGCAALWLIDYNIHPSASGVHGTISCFREALREGLCTKEYIIEKASQRGKRHICDSSPAGDR